MKILLIGFVDKRDLWNKYEEINDKDATYHYFDHHPVIMAKMVTNILNNYSNYFEMFVFSSSNEDLFNLFGHFVAEKKIDRNLIDVVFIDNGGVEHRGSYSKEGFLEGLPWGFFDMDIDLYLKTLIDIKDGREF